MIADTMDDHGADVVREVGEAVLDCENDVVVQRIASRLAGRLRPTVRTAPAFSILSSDARSAFAAAAFPMELIASFPNSYI